MSSIEHPSHDHFAMPFMNLQTAGSPLAGTDGDFLDLDTTASAVALAWVGVDVGSTTVKIAAIDPKNGRMLHWRYRRHNACQAETALSLIKEFQTEFPHTAISLGICGSGAEPLALATGGRFVQEVIATAVAVTEQFPFVRTAIELGGQDAKILFFELQSGQEKTRLSDMRMNGCCAGGTGAFLDQMALLLGIPVEDFNEFAERGRTVYNISGRCGVFAKTDLQPLLNMGVPKEDLALSVYHAVARQTIASLAMGTAIHAPVAFLGGPFSFSPVLIQTFAHQLGFKPEALYVPGHPQIMAAIGAACSAGREAGRGVSCTAVVNRLEEHLRIRTNGNDANAVPLFDSAAEREDFEKRHAVAAFVPRFFASGTVAPVYVGIDAGSTTLKLVLIDEAETVVDKFYAPNSGEPLVVAREALLAVRDRYAAKGVTLDIKGLGTTGYGEALFAAAFGADYHTVETIAHACAAVKYVPDATFVLDIGGQDMKAMHIENGVICDIHLNEACSAGCGSFIETLAKSLGIPLAAIVATALKSKAPSQLGARCTVFMNSSITTEQKNGKPIEDIVAGLCCSVVSNVFDKVLRIASPSVLGPRIVVQGGTFNNNAVLRAFERRVGTPVVRAPHCGEMGALGVALLAKKAMHASPGIASRFIGFDALMSFGMPATVQEKCTRCANSCSRTIVRFSTGAVYCTGNRCEKGAVESPATRTTVVTSSAQSERSLQAPSCAAERDRALLRAAAGAHAVADRRSTIIGIPRVLEFWNSLPYWKTVFSTLGFSVVLSGKSTTALAEKGQRFIASDNICFPLKLAHGHIEELIAKKVGRIFLPMLASTPSLLKHAEAVYMCPLVHGAPVIMNAMNRPQERAAIPLDAPAFHWHTPAMRNRQVADYLRDTFACSKTEIRSAIAAADKAQQEFYDAMQAEGTKTLSWAAEKGRMGVVLLGRPYHFDPFINHGIPELLSALGAAVLTVDSLPGLSRIDLGRVRPDLFNPFHSQLYAAALFAAHHPNLEIVQMVSFGCGHDAIISDELVRLISQTTGKRPLILKIDDGEARGSLNIRIRSFVETVRGRRNSA